MVSEMINDHDACLDRPHLHNRITQLKQGIPSVAQQGVRVLCGLIFDVMLLQWG